MKKPTGADENDLEPRIGIDLGGTKIEGIILAPASENGENRFEGKPPPPTNDVLVRRRIATPQQDYAGTIRAICELVQALEGDLAKQTAQHHQSASTRSGIGVGIPGSIAPKSGLVQNANSTWLNGKAFQQDLSQALRRDVRCANDANCFALSEAVDGAGFQTQTVFGVILGTGCGGGLVHARQLIDGPRAIGGEWGHNPLPWPQIGKEPNTDQQQSESKDIQIPAPPSSELPGPSCWCGRNGCMETWVSGPGMAADHKHHTKEVLDAQTIADRAFGMIDVSSSRREEAQQTLKRHASRLARGLASVTNLIDPDVIILGGGLSKLVHLYDDLPALMAPYIFAADRSVQIKPPRWGDASGARGAAWLWN